MIGQTPQKGKYFKLVVFWKGFSQARVKSRLDPFLGTTGTSHLLKIVKGKRDPVLLAMKGLSNRGLDKDGKWLGLNKAQKHWDVPECIKKEGLK